MYMYIPLHPMHVYIGPMSAFPPCARPFHSATGFDKRGRFQSAGGFDIHHTITYVRNSITCVRNSITYVYVIQKTACTPLGLRKISCMVSFIKKG